MLKNLSSTGNVKGLFTKKKKIRKKVVAPVAWVQNHSLSPENPYCEPGLQCPFCGQKKKSHFMSIPDTHPLFRLMPEDWTPRRGDQTAGVRSLTEERYGHHPFNEW